MAFGWHGKLVRLVPLDRQRHLENALQWINDPEVTGRTIIGDLPLARLAEEEFFKRAEAGPEDAITFAVETLAGEHVGFSGLMDIDYRHGVARTGSFIGRSDLWGRGLGTDAARVRTTYAFEILGLRLLLADVLLPNPASCRMLERVGYTQVGRIEARYFKRGAYRDLLLYAVHRDQRPAAGASPEAREV